MDNQTLHTYNKSAKQLADKFAGIGSRKADVKRAFELRGKANPRVLELGCGDGRDAKEILKGTKNYAGIDYSSELIELARAKNPKTKFEVRDMLSPMILVRASILSSLLPHYSMLIKQM